MNNGVGVSTDKAVVAYFNFYLGILLEGCGNLWKFVDIRTGRLIGL
jgi:hypothetical protein